MQHWHKSCWNMNAYFCAWFIVALLRAVWLSFVVSCSSSFEPESTSFFLLCMNYEPWATTAFLFQASSCRPVSLLISLGPALHWDFGFWNSHCFVTALHSGVMLHFTWLILWLGVMVSPQEGAYGEIWERLALCCCVVGYKKHLNVVSSTLHACIWAWSLTRALFQVCYSVTPHKLSLRSEVFLTNCIVGQMLTELKTPRCDGKGQWIE